MADRTVAVKLQALVSQYIAQMGAATGATKAFGLNAVKAGGAASGAFKLLGAATLVAAGAGIKMAADFDASMTKMVSLVGLTRGEVDGMKDDILSLSSQTGISANELAEAMFFITSAGLRGADAMEALESSAKAAATGMGETKDIADAVTSAMNAYGHDVLGAADATAILVAAVREGKAEGADFAPVMGRLVPIASEVGISFDQVAAGLAVLTRTSGDAAQSATQLEGIMRLLIKPSEQAVKTLAEMGISMEDLRSQVREEGLLATLQTLSEAFEGNDDAMGKVFGRIRGIQGALSLTGAQAGEARRIFSELASTTSGELDKSFAAASETTQFKFAKALETGKNILIELGDALLPVVNTVLDFVGAVAGAVPPMGLAAAAIAGLTLKAIGLSTALRAVPWIAVGVAATKMFESVSENFKSMDELGSAAGVTAEQFEAMGRAMNSGAGRLKFWRGATQDAQDAAEVFNEVLEEATGLGLSQAEAQARLSAAFETSVDKLGGLNGGLEEFREALREGAGLDAMTSRTANYARIQAEARGATEGTTDAVDDLGGEAQDAATATEQLNDALAGLIGGALGSEKALISWRESIRGMTGAIEEGSQSLKGNSQEADDNRKAILQAVDAALAHGTAVAEETGSLNKGARAVQGHMRELISQARQAGISEGAIRSYLRELGLTPKQVRTIIEANADPAKRQLRETQAMLDRINGMVATARVNIVETRQRAAGGGFIHAGGVAGETGARRLHSGGVATRGDEFLSVLQRGERVFSKREGRIMDAILQSARGISGGGASVSGHPITVNLDGRQHRGILHGDEVVEALTKYERRNGPLPVRTR